MGDVDPKVDMQPSAYDPAPDWYYSKQIAYCRGCPRRLERENIRIADGCPCNSARGINHGIVPKNTCTCVECDPEQTGSTRYPPA